MRASVERVIRGYGERMPPPDTLAKAHDWGRAKRASVLAKRKVRPTA